MGRSVFPAWAILWHTSQNGCAAGGLKVAEQLPTLHPPQARPFKSSPLLKPTFRAAKSKASRDYTWPDLLMQMTTWFHNSVFSPAAHAG